MARPLLHASRCRLVAVAGYSGGPSVIRMISADGRPCAIPHYTVNCTRRHVHQRVHKTTTFSPVAMPHHGHMRAHSNRVSYRGHGHDRFAYSLRDRAGHRHQIHVQVVRR